MYKIALITGDGIGPELSESVIDVLDTVNDKIGVKIQVTKLQAGDTALKKTGKALPDETLDEIKKSDHKQLWPDCKNSYQRKCMAM